MGLLVRPIGRGTHRVRDFESLLWHPRPDIRTLHIVDPIFGALVFVGVRVEPATIEIADFEADPDYWAMIENDPND